LRGNAGADESPFLPGSRPALDIYDIAAIRPKRDLAIVPAGKAESPSEETGGFPEFLDPP